MNGKALEQQTALAVFHSFHWDSLPLTLLQESLAYWCLLVLFHAIPRRGASLECVESLT